SPPSRPNCTLGPSLMYHNNGRGVHKKGEAEGGTSLGVPYKGRGPPPPPTNFQSRFKKKARPCALSPHSMTAFPWIEGVGGDAFADGKRLEAVAYGPPPGQAPTIVMLHEGLGCLALWRDFPQKLAAATGHGVFAYSRAGYGGGGGGALPPPP